MQDVVVDGIARPQDPIGEHVGVRAAALARNRVDALDVLGPEIVQDLGDEPDRFARALESLEGAYDVGDGASYEPTPVLLDRVG